MENNKFSKKEEMIFLISVSFFWFAQYVYIPYQTIYLTSINVGTSFIGIIVGAYGISQMLLRLPVGLSADIVRKHKYFIMIGGLSSGMASLFRVLMPNGVGFLIANLLSGLASAMWISFMVFYTGHFSAEEQQSATARIVMFNNIGMLMGFIASTLLYNSISMRGLCVLSVCGGVMTFLLSLSIKEEAPEKSTHKISELISVCSNKRLLLFSFIALIQQGVQLTTSMSFTNQVLGDLGASNAIIGISSIIYMISSVTFSALSSRNVFKGGPRILIPTVLVIIATYCVLVPTVNSVPVIMALQILPGTSSGILFSCATSEAMKEVKPFQKSTAMGFFQAFYAIGMTTFPMLTGKLASSYSMSAGFFVLAGIAVLGCLIAVTFYRVEKNCKVDKAV